MAEAAARAANAALRSVTPRAWRAILAGWFAAMATLGCGRETYYSADAITARVVDADTREPLAGVNVVAGWEVKGGLEGGNTMGWVMVMEAVTDASGTFNFPAWGPKRLNVTGAIDNRSPILILFKAGYAHERLNDRARPWDQLAPFSRDGNTLNPIPSYWNGKTIPLRRFDGSVAQYSEQLDFLQVSITTLLQYGECAFRAVPKFLWSVEQQRRVFQDQQVRSTLSSLTGLSDAFSGKCGSLKSFVEEHAK